MRAHLNSDSRFTSLIEDCNVDFNNFMNENVLSQSQVEPNIDNTFDT